MTIKPNLPPYYLPLMLLLLAGSSFVYGFNCFYLHYPGNAYYPPGNFYSILILVLLIIGFRLLWMKKPNTFLILRHVVFFYATFGLFLFATNAVQFTPFAPIDNHIIAFEKFFSINTIALFKWTQHHPQFRYLLIKAYNFLSYEMAILPLIVIFLVKENRFERFLILNLCCVLLGYGFYYFFPTTAPASVMSGFQFLNEQMATGQKFYELHHYIRPTTIDGGLISLPSFHIILSWLCIDLVRNIKFLFYPALLVNVLIIVSAVFLGWHYISDFFGSAIIIGLSQWFYRSFCHRNLAKREMLDCVKNALPSH